MSQIECSFKQFIFDCPINLLKLYFMEHILFWLVPGASVLALCFAWYFHRQMMKESEGFPWIQKRISLTYLMKISK